MERFMDFMMTPVFYIAWWGYLHYYMGLAWAISWTRYLPAPRDLDLGDIYEGIWGGGWRLGTVNEGSSEESVGTGLYMQARLDARPGLVIGCADWFCCGQGQGWWQCACVTVTIRCTASLGLLFKYLWRQVSFASLVSLVLEHAPLHWIAFPVQTQISSLKMRWRNTWRGSFWRIVKIVRICKGNCFCKSQ